MTGCKVANFDRLGTRPSPCLIAKHHQIGATSQIYLIRKSPLADKCKHGIAGKQRKEKLLVNVKSAFHIIYETFLVINLAWYRSSSLRSPQKPLKACSHPHDYIRLHEDSEQKKKYTGKFWLNLCKQRHLPLVSPILFWFSSGNTRTSSNFFLLQLSPPPVLDIRKFTPFQPANPSLFTLPHTRLSNMTLTESLEEDGTRIVVNLPTMKTQKACII